MAQATDYNLANQTGADFRAELNEILAASVSLNSGSSEPTTMYAHQLWVDTSSNELKIRNAANNAWLTTGVSITSSNSFVISSGSINGITALSFSSGATVASILDEDNLASDSATALATQQSIKAYVDSQVTAQDLDISDGSSTIAIDLDSETLSLLGGTGITSTASGNGVTFAIGQSVGTSDNVVFNQVTGALVGNASTATTLATARTISGVSFDGSANITLDTDDIGEGSSNLYYTDARARASISENSAQLSYNSGTGVLTYTQGDTDTVSEGSSNLYYTSARANADFDTRLATKSTSDLSEGTNLYYTTARFDSAFTGKDTDDLSEGSTNVYYTDARANSAIDARVTNTFINNLSGVVADTATALATARTIALSGDVTASGVSFDGTANITLSTTIAANSVALGTDTTGNYISTIAGTTNEIDVSGSGSETATVTIGLPDDVTIAGNLTVNGTTTTVNSDTLAVTDPLIKLAKSNSGADSLDIGFYGLYDTSGSQDLYAGLFRDANDSGKFKLFKDLQSEPTTTVNTGGTGYAVGTLVSNLEGNVTGNVTGSSGSTTGNAATATALETARTIGGVSFNGTANIDLAGVNTTGNQDTSGNAATATALATGRTIGMTGDVVWTSASFDGSGNVTGTATIQPNSVALSTDTTGDYVSTITAGTGLTSTGATSGEGIAHTLSVDAAQTQITSVGALDGGSITSGFGSIDVGSSAITTSGTVTGGTLTGTLSTAAQTNITSVGTLTSFRSTGIDDNADALAITIDSSENVGIGNSTPSNNHANANNLVVGNGSAGGIANYVGTGLGWYAFSRDNANNTDAYDGGMSYDGSRNLMFHTNAGSERMRLNSSGVLLVGVSSFSDSSGGTQISKGLIKLSADTTSSATKMFFTNANGTVGTIITSGSATAYNTSSDARLKDVTGEARGLEVINKLNPVAYNWKADGKADEGLIAQEVLDIVPNAVSGSEEDMYQMDYSKLVVHLVAGMKEQQTQIEELKAEIQNLKGE